MSPEIVQEERSAYRRPGFELRLRTVLLPDGSQKIREIVEEGPSVAIVPLLADGRVRLIRQFRSPFGGWLIELPAGGMEPGESAEMAARRELAEEAGLAAGNLEYLGVMCGAPGLSTERIHLYLANGLRFTDAAHDPDEHIVCLDLDWQACFRLISEGAIFDTKTVAGLTRAALHLQLLRPCPPVENGP